MAELPVLVLDDQEPGELLVELGQAPGRSAPGSATMARTSVGLDSSPPPWVSSFSTAIACAA